jgi:CheY-like chemotaxis protein
MNTIGASHGPGVLATVLVVDDYDLIRSVVRMTLEDEGYAVVEAADGAAALLLAKATAPALILLDLTMPVLDGPGFVAAYRSEPGPHAPIVVLSGAKDEEAWLTELGVVAHIHKPFELEELVTMVSRIVGVSERAPI